MHSSPMPAEYIVEESVILEVGSVPYEFAVKATVFGELLSIDNLFTRLPEAAQKLTLGEGHKTILWQLNHFEKLFKYKLALLLVNGQEPAGPIASILQSIVQRRKQFGLPPQPAEYDRVQDEWTRQFFRYCPEPRKENKGTREERETYIERQQKVRVFGGLFRTSDGNPAHTIQWLASRKMELACPVIVDLISCLPEDNNLSTAYECLRFFPNSVGKQLLLSHAQKESKHSHRAAILKGLSGFKDPEILKLYLDLYKSSYDKLDQEEVNCLFMGLQNYPVSEVKAIGWEVLGKPEKQGKYQAYHLLKSLNISETDISQAMFQVFYHLKDMEQIQHYLTIFLELRKPELTPSTGHLIQLFEKYCSSEQGQKLVSLISSILSQKPDFEAEPKLLYWLSDDSPYLWKAALAGMYNFVIEGGYRPSEVVISILSGILTFPEPAVRTQAIDLVRKIPQVIRKPQFVPLLMSVVMAENGRPNRAVLMAINGLLEYIPFPAEIVPFYLELLEDQNDEIRQDALRGLKYSFDEDIRQRFKKMEADDPAESGRMEAFHAYRFSKKREYQLHSDLPEPVPSPPKFQQVDKMPATIPPELAELMKPFLNPDGSIKKPKPQNSFFSKILNQLKSFLKNK